MEIIESIEKVNDLKLEEDGWDYFEGFKIKTNSQEILVLISNDQSCCENAGFLSTNDNIEDFVGAALHNIEKVTDALDKAVIEKHFEYDFDENGIIFINLQTSKGTLQLVVYNMHNGYYGHAVKVRSQLLNLDESL